MAHVRPVQAILPRRRAVRVRVGVLEERGCYAETLYKDDDAMLDDFQEAASIFEETARTARRVLGGTHPLTVNIEHNLRKVRAELRASLKILRVAPCKIKRNARREEHQLMDLKKVHESQRQDAERHCEREEPSSSGPLNFYLL